MSYLKKLEQEKNRIELSLVRNEIKVSNEERKARTRRVIQKGALLEKYFECENLSVEETEELLVVFSDYVIKNKPVKYKKGTE